MKRIVILLIIIFGAFTFLPYLHSQASEYNPYCSYGGSFTGSYQMTTYNTYIIFQIPVYCNSATQYGTYLSFTNAYMISSPQTFGIGSQYGNFTLTSIGSSDIAGTTSLQASQTNAFTYIYGIALTQITVNGLTANAPFSSSPPTGGSNVQIYQASNYIEVQTFVNPSTIDFGIQSSPSSSSGVGSVGSGGTSSSTTLITTTYTSGQVVIYPNPNPPPQFLTTTITQNETSIITTQINPQGRPFSTNALSFAVGSIVIMFAAIGALAYWARGHPKQVKKLSLGDTKLPSLTLGGKKKRRRLRL